MSLSKRLANVQPNKANNGCQTCHWLATLTHADKQAWDDWLAQGRSAAQLWEIAINDPDNPLKVSMTAFRHHQHHARAKSK